jgi:hypothetical protein
MQRPGSRLEIGALKSRAQKRTACAKFQGMRLVQVQGGELGKASGGGLTEDMGSTEAYFIEKIDKVNTRDDSQFHVTLANFHAWALVGPLRRGCQPSNRLVDRPLQIHTKFPPTSALAKSPSCNTITAIMSHESVWNSRPRNYGKGSRQWYEA